jgi:hypothetical protein
VTACLSDAVQLAKQAQADLTATRFTPSALKCQTTRQIEPPRLWYWKNPKKACPMRDRDATESVRVPVVPSCRKCHEPRRLHVTEVDPAVQYWSCEACGLVWATRDGEDLRSIAADRTPRGSK